MSVVSDRFRRRLFPLLILGLGFFAFLLHLAMTTSVAAPRAQETATPAPVEASPSSGPQLMPEPEPGEWAPVNLSRSGVANNASTVVDTSGVVHVVWQEEGVDTFYYAQGQDDQWSYPAQLEFPFGTRAYTPELAEDDDTPLYQPQFVAAGERVIVFWIDNEGVAYSSSVPHSDFTTFAAWSTPEAIAGNVLKLSAVVGEEGVLHVGYVRNAETEGSPAGIYYVSSDSSGADWSEPVLLYGSRYFRALPAEEAHVQIATNGAATVFVAWDSPLIDQIFVVKSDDGGETWGAPEVVDSHRSDDAPEAPGPAQIQVLADGEGVHLAWTAGHTTPLCTIYHRWSSDGGETWEEPEQVLAETTDCPERPRLVRGFDDLLFLVTAVGTEARLVAWQEGQWSDPQLQSGLSSFLNQANNRRVEFQWQDVVLFDGNRLLAIGANVAPTRDIWALVGSIGTVTDWFPPPSPWQAAASLGNYPFRPEDVVMVAGPDDTVHAFWMRRTASDSGVGTVEYARWRDSEWSRPSPVLSSPSDPLTDLSVAFGPSGRLHAVWSADSGGLYFSQAVVSEAHIARAWSEPRMLPVDDEAVRSPVVSVDENGILYVAYAITLNEERGVFLTLSDDQGGTWATPVQVFDGVAAGWEMVDEPRLAARADGVLHLLWTRYSLPPRFEPLGLFYARSEDQGESWSTAEMVDEEGVVWSEIVYGQDRVLHQVWQKQSDAGYEFWYRSSSDEGDSWTRAETAGLRSMGGGASELAVGPNGRLHLVHLVDDALSHWWWEEGAWIEGERLAVGAPAEQAADAYEPLVAVAVAADGSAVVLYLHPAVLEGQEETVQYQLLAAERTLEGVEVGALATSTPNSRPTQTPTATFTPTPSPTATSAPSFPREETGGGGAINIPGTGSAAGQIAISIALVGLLIIGVALFTLRTFWHGRK